MKLTNHNTTLRSLCKHCCSMAVIAILFIQLLCFSYTAAEYMNNYDGGFSARLIRRNSPNSPLYNNKRNRVVRRLMGPDIPQSALVHDMYVNFMKFSVGTPPFDIYLVLDTGSSLLWTQCEPCKRCFKTKHGIFDPRKSLTYRKLTCSDRECKQFDEFSHEKYCNKNPFAPCRYNQTYLGTSFSLGEVAKEVITLKSTSGKAVVLKDIVIGCGGNNYESDMDEDDITNEMGVIGLGRGPMSFISQISSYVGGRIFSQCLMPMDTDPEIESYINFGSRSKVSGEGAVTTPLVDIESDMESYYVTVKGITIGNDYLPFNSTGALPEKGNTFIDSGTPMSYLPRDLHERVVNQLVDKLDLKLEPFNYTENDGINSTSICFNTTTIPKAPNVVLHFDDGGKLQLTTGIIFRDEEKHDMVCLGFMDSSDKGFPRDAVLGNNVQGNILIGFDLDRKMVSFKPTNCMKMETAQSPHATEL